MLINRLRAFLRPAAEKSPTPAFASPSAAVGAEAPLRAPNRPGVPVYPPLDHGVAVATADEVLATQSELIGRLRLAAGCDDESFERLYGCVLRNLADAVNLLPATEAGTHNGAGGLFRLSLEVAFYAFQASEATIFAARAGVEKRRELEPRWRYATFLAGLCAELHRPITQMMVTCADGAVWPAYQIGLCEWLRGRSADRYFVRWVPVPPGVQRPGQGATSYLAHRIIPVESLQYLHEGAIEIAPTLFDCVTGVKAGAFDASPLHKIIVATREKVIARDEAVRPQHYGKLRVGAHLEPHLLDAMRRLMSDGTWSVNVRKARLWYSREGLFLVWKTAAKEILGVLQRDGTSGVPQDPQTLIEILLDAQVLQPDDQGSPYWTIQPPEAANELVAVKFAHPLALLAALPIEPDPIASVLRASDPSAPPQSSNSAPATESAQQTAEAGTAPNEVCAQPPSEPAPTTDKDPSAEPKASADKAGPKRRAATHTPSGTKGTGAHGECDVGQNVPESLGKAITPLCRDVIGALIDDLRAGKGVVQAGKHPLGFAIGIEQVASYGVDATRFVEEISRLGWLVPHPEKPNKKFHEAQLAGKPARAIVIQQPIAFDLGLLS